VRNFFFSLNPEEISIGNQAEWFSLYLSGSGIIEGVFRSDSNKLRQNQSLLRDVYIYSYIKAVVYATGIVNNDLFAMMGPNNNLVFAGHKQLHDSIVEGTIHSISPPRNLTSVEFNIQLDLIEEFKTWKIWDEISSQGRVYNPEFERVLIYLKEKAKHLLKIDEIGRIVPESTKNLLTSPIGNLVYSQDMLSLLFVEDSSLVNDKKSYYFGKANMICVAEVPIIDADDEIYDTILVSNYDPYGVAFEVESITGFNPLSGIKTIRDMTDNGSGSDGNNYGQGGGPSTPRNPKHPNNPSSNRPRIKYSSDNKSNKLAVLKDKVSSLKTQAVNLIKSTNKLLSSDEVQLLAAVISEITGKNISPRKLKSRINEPIERILHDYKISIKDNLIGSNEEYDALYGETEFINGRYETTLTGRQRAIMAPQ
jgi:hypothetical protein